MSPEAWQQGGKRFVYRGVHSIFYREAGEGQALVLLHGFPTASWDWHKVWEPLAGRYRVIALDFIGFGFSAKPGRYSYSILDQADLVEALLRSLGISHCHILAHDYGDSVAQELLARDQERQEGEGLRIGRTVLLNGGIFPESHRPRPIQKALISPLGFLLRPFLTRRSLRKNFNAIFGPGSLPTEEEIDGFYGLIQYNNGRRVFHKLIRYMRDRVVHRERWVRALLAAGGELRFVVGCLDPISGRHVAERFRELAEAPDVVLLERIGHYPQTEAPEELLEAIGDFFDK